MIGAKLGLIAIAVILSRSAVGQSAPRREFEVASIKPSSPSAGLGRTLDLDSGGLLRAVNITPKMLIAFAYNVKEFQISGGPKWLDSERYDINAKPDPTTEKGPGFEDRERQRVQSLLEDRFQLKFHRESKRLPIYALVVSKDGPKLTPAASAGRHDLSGGRGGIKGKGISMASLADALSDRLTRPVLDQTGLTGAYDFTLEWTPGLSQPASAGGPSLFTAIQEQLGLKLASQKGPVEILVIDHAEKASEN